MLDKHEKVDEEKEDETMKTHLKAQDALENVSEQKLKKLEGDKI